MIIPQPKDAIHKAWMYKLLIHFADDIELMQHLRFKGGTCAAMLGWLDRFSVDLDFDLLTEHTTPAQIRKRIEQHAEKLGLRVDDRSHSGVQYFFKYDAPEDERNTLKVECQFPPSKTNLYAPTYFAEIDRTIPAQTIETMLANKLVAVLERWEKHGSVAGRDIYDIHSFFLQGTRYRTEVIEERRSISVANFFAELISFVEQKITSTVIQQDLNSLLLPEQFQRIRKTLVAETLMLLRDELRRIQS